MKLSERIAALVDVKSIVTLVMTCALVVMLFSGATPPSELLALYCTSYGSVITYFFTRRKET